MSRYSSLLGLPPSSLNLLCAGIAVFIGCTGARIYQAPNLSLKIANAQLITSTSADKLENLAEQLKKQVQVIKRKDEAYDQLEVIYEGYLTNEKGGIELDKAFDVIQELPEVENTEEIETQIDEVEDDLLGIVED